MVLGSCLSTQPKIKFSFFTEHVALQVPTIIFLLTIPYTAAHCDNLLQEIVSHLHEMTNYKDADCCNMVNEITMHVSKSGFSVSAQGFFDVQPSMVLSVRRQRAGDKLG